MAEESKLIADLTRLRDHLKAVSNAYNMLALYLREVNTLATQVGADYYGLESPSVEVIKRLEEWRLLERNLVYAIKHHSKNNFTPYKLYEDAFMKELYKSAGNLTVKRDSVVKLKARRFKDGVIALKYATEAQRRSQNIAQFIADIKRLTKRDPSDYVDNMIILNALLTWTKEVIKDCVRCTASSSDKFNSEESNGQIIYTNEVIKSLAQFSSDRTRSVARSKRTNVHTLAEELLEQPVLSDSKIMPNYGVKSSSITYYFYKLLEDSKNNTALGNDKLKLLSTVIEKMNIPLSISHPYHLYQVYEYFSSITKSNEFLKLIHGTQQAVIRSASISLAKDTYQIIERLLSIGIDPKMDLRPILVAVRMAKFMSAPEKQLVGIWDNPPFSKS
ncbi:hypothetical protein BgAZ_305000 [Babesia gibsoni]|uniref:Uncharacterized protein n=1 Tax=Babesia gibsoni TaxID=33632 RepID=A0AAD8PE10_BABGI|nr:hypothetical protein BgAZ_305000 [Babesia gibsoni]